MDRSRTPAPGPCRPLRPSRRRRPGRVVGVVLALSLFAAGGGCGAPADDVATAPPAPAADPGPRAAVAVLSPASGSDVRGVVRFEERDAGVAVVAGVRGLSPGPHAYHVHLYGDCSAADATSAGTHFNFVGDSEDPPDDIARITGNLGELEAGSDGAARHEAHVVLATLRGPKSIVGRAVVVHARGNDPTQPPMGAAGGRVACGVIGIDEPPSGD